MRRFANTKNLARHTTELKKHGGARIMLLSRVALKFHFPHVGDFHRTWGLATIFFIAIIALLFVNEADSQETRRPLIVVPGIVGSVLSEDGQIVWGGVRSLNKSNFQKLDLLPKQGAPVDLQPTDILRDVPLLFGLVRVGIYSGLIDFLEDDLGYREGNDLFVFPYDWRRTSFAAAKRLSEFIEDRVGDREYDLLAHSMGGIVTRLMLGGGRSGGICEVGESTHPILSGVSAEELSTLCEAMYGPNRAAGEAVDTWPSDFFTGPYEVAGNLHTYIEMAVPHFGSNNAVGTFLEGWGSLSRILAGGQGAIQNVLLSMPSPIELAPVYENCCAKGRAGAAGNRALKTLDEKLDFAWWSQKILGFGVVPCPYHRCDSRRRMLAASLELRKAIDEIVAERIPDSVKRLVVFIGIDVENTRIVHYVARNAPGDGKGVTYQINQTGDGTVAFVSARAPETYPGRNVQEVIAARIVHPFIFESQALQDQLRFAILYPKESLVIQVSGEVVKVAGETVASSAAVLKPQIALPRDRVELKVSITTEGAVERSNLASQTFAARVRNAATGALKVSATLTLDDTASFPENGELVIVGSFLAPASTNVFLVEVVDDTGTDDTVIEKALLWVIDKE